MTEERWIYGYGSLIWKPDFEFIKKAKCYIKGYSRRFWQKSDDHRGTPESPGRVVTIIKDKNKKLYGMAYQLDNRVFKELLPRLDHREKCGYERNMIPIYDEYDNLIYKEALLYIGPENGPEFVKDEPIKETAKIIAYSVGPSGKNTEYLFNLRKALLNLKIKEEYLYNLEYEVKKFQLHDTPTFVADDCKMIMNSFNKNDRLAKTFDIVYNHVSKQTVKGRMLVSKNHQQPMGILHGGVSVVFAESLGSMAASFVSSEIGKVPVGMEINANHINGVIVDELNFVIGEATPIHTGGNSHIWQIIIKREDNGKIVCVSRLTCFLKSMSKL
eukprot:gene1297-11381_t